MNAERFPIFKTLAAGLLAALTCFLISCQGEIESEDAATNPDFPHSIATPVDFYTGSPAQARPPDGQLPVGTRVRVIEDAGSYVRILSEDGKSAYIAADSITGLKAP